MTVTDISPQRRAEDEAARTQRLIGETHHRAKNHFQFASSLLELKKPRDRANPVAGILNDSQARLSALAALHDTLHQYAGTGSVDLRRYLERVCSALQQVYAAESTVCIDVAFEPDAVDDRRRDMEMQSAVVTGIATSELVSNAVKYGMQANGTVAIRIVVEGDGETAARVRVEDDGPGVSPDFQVPDSLHTGLGLVAGLLRDSIGCELVALDCGEEGADRHRCTLGGACFAFSVPLCSDAEGCA